MARNPYESKENISKWCVYQDLTASVHTPVQSTQYHHSPTEIKVCDTQALSSP